MAGKTKPRSPEAPSAPATVVRSKPVRRSAQLPDEALGVPTPTKALEAGSQPIISPYTTRPITILIGTTKVPHFIPSYFLWQFPRWRDEYGPDSHKDTLELPEVHESVDHTFVHYLYTGTYQTTRSGDTAGAPRHVLEYKRSVLTGAAATAYGVDNLVTLAKQHTAHFRPRVSLADTLDVARSVYSSKSENHWLGNYVKSELAEAYDVDEAVFTKPVYLGVFGRAPEFDKLLVKTMVELLTNRISQLKAEVQDQVDAHLSIYATPESVPNPGIQLLRPYINAPAVAEILAPKNRSWDSSSTPGLLDRRRAVSVATSVGGIQGVETSWPSWQKDSKSRVPLSRGRGPGGLFY